MRRKQTPLILQMEGVECGAAALASILGYYKKSISLEELRIACDVSRDGCNAENILKAAKEYGLDCDAYSIELEDLSEIELPCILHWSFNHFVILEGITKEGYYLNDPALGYRFVSAQEMDEEFTGVVLTFEPNKDFIPNNKQVSFKTIIQGYIQDSEHAVIYLIITGLLLTIPTLLVPIFTKLFLDNILIAKMHSWIMPFLIGMTIIALVDTGIYWLQQKCLLRFSTNTTIKTTTNFLWHLLRLPCQFFYQRSVGDIVNRISLNEQISNLIVYNLSSVIVQSIRMLFVAFLLLYFSIGLSLIIFFTTLFDIFLAKALFARQQQLQVKILNDSAKQTGNEIGALNIIESLKACGNESIFFKKWAETNAKLANNAQKLQKSLLNSSSIIQFSINLTVILILILGAAKILAGTMTIGTLVAYQSLTILFFQSITFIIDITNKVQAIIASQERIDDINNYEVDSMFLQAYRPIDTLLKNDEGKLQGHIVFEDVTFGYRRLSEPLINKLCFEVKPGQRVGLVGTTGCGKSTIAKLLMQVYHPWSGNIYIDDVPIQEIDPLLLNYSMSIVSQEIFLFDDTIKNNITFWDDTIGDATIIAASKDACIHDVISAHENSYMWRISERGGNLSGGQSQRFEIARALANNPSILILDEATSALDDETEGKVIGNINRRGITILNIAHRLASVRDCDSIIVMDNGAIAEIGSHETLIAMGGIYAKLIGVS